MKRQSVHEMFSEAAERFAENVAIERLNKRVSYRELEENSNRLANFLAASGAAKGTRVAILAEDSIEIITAITGILKAGCVFVPLDSRSPRKRLQAMVAEVDPTWFVIESKFSESLNEIAAGLTSKARVLCVAKDDAADEHQGNLNHNSLDYIKDYSAYHQTEKLHVESQPDDMCYIYFTSGSTGRPKGIAGRLKAIDHFIRWEIKTFDVNEKTRVSQLTGPAFDAFLRDAFVPLCAGGTVCVPGDRETMLDAGKLSEWIDRQQINMVHCVPSVFRAILSAELNPAYFSSLKYILMAGEPLLPVDVEKWMSVYGERVQLVNLYGPSETTMVKFFYFVKHTDRQQRFISIGKPMEGARALVVDEKGEICPQGTVGEIYIRTPFRTLGYYNRPELTAEVFIQNPFSDIPGDLVYKTGDLARILDDGNFEFLGRKDSQVKIRGVRVELTEIENLLRSHPSVKNVAVLDRDDATGNKFLCAYLVLSEDVEPRSLKEHLSQSLPEYMVPTSFVRMEALPLNVNGKVDRRALLAFSQNLDQQEREFVAPRTPVEEVLARIWQQVLGVERVSVHDNFFESGGHSLLATQLFSRIRAELGVEAPLLTLFGAPTIAQLALALTNMQAEQEDEEEMARMIEEIQRLSEDALDSTLDEEIQATKIRPAS